MSNMTGFMCGAGYAYPLRAHAIIPSFDGVSVVQLLVFYVLLPLCGLLFVVFLVVFCILQWHYCQFVIDLRV